VDYGLHPLLEGTDRFGNTFLHVGVPVSFHFGHDLLHIGFRFCQIGFCLCFRLRQVGVILGG
jgi:hypothetical protein